MDPVGVFVIACMLFCSAAPTYILYALIVHAMSREMPTVGTSGIDHTVLENDEDIGFSVRSGVPINENNEVLTEAEDPSSGSTAEEDKDLDTPVEIATSQGKIGSNLKSEMLVDTIVTT